MGLEEEKSSESEFLEKFLMAKKRKELFGNSEEERKDEDFAVKLLGDLKKKRKDERDKAYLKTVSRPK